MTKPLNLFYQEPDPDRWVRFDRYPRRLLRRLLRGKPHPSGVQMIAINLTKGLDRLAVPYRLNDYKYIRSKPDEIACIIGRHHVLFEKKWENPVIFGAGIYSHPVECPNLFELYPNVKRFLVPGEWMRDMCAPYYGNKVIAWPVGTDTSYWKPGENSVKPFDFLIYDKIRWDHTEMEAELINPVIKTLTNNGNTYHFIRYGSYTHKELMDKLKVSKAVIFLCEHETQGLAYQQILSTNTPILAWDRAGYWQDPYYYPHKEKYRPVSSVPYWDDRCGIKFEGAFDFQEKLQVFLSNYASFIPRDYIMENLTLEICAKRYLDIVGQVEGELG